MYIFQPERYLTYKFIKELGSKITGRTLDIGAGIYDRYSNLFLSSEYIKMSLKKNNNIDIVGRIEEIPFPDNSLDSVICTSVFEYLKNPQKGMNEILRVLKPDGYALITAPQTNEIHDDTDDLADDYWRFTKNAFDLMSDNRVVEYRQIGGFFTTIAQMKIRYLINTLKLYDRPILGRIMSKIFKIISLLALKFDKKPSNFTIGWVILIKK